MGALLVCNSFERSSRAGDAPLDADAKVAPVASTTAVTASSPTDAVEWFVSGAVGPVFAGLAAPSAGIWPPAAGLTSTAWQVELRRRRPNERFVAGVTIEGTYDRGGGGGAGPQLLGLDAFIGKDWQHRHWSLEATIGAGLEAAGAGVEAAQESQTYGSTTTFTYTYRLAYQLGLYTQGTLAAAVPVSNAVDILVRLGVHLSAAHDEDWFAASTIGLRYRLP